MNTKYLFIVGGVMSSLGKGILTSSIGLILKSKGYKVSIVKFDPYLNVDAGLQNPYQHGEVFVTCDGAETDLDLGHYERYLNQDLYKSSNVTSGSVYQRLIEKERRGEYLGATVQVIPHLINEIQNRILDHVKETNADIVISEIGGTIGDIEGSPFLEAIREFTNDQSPEDTALIHLTYLPHLSATGELKTKPTQHSVAELRRVGVKSNIIACRSDIQIGEDIRNKISLFCDVKRENVFAVLDAKNIYNVPQMIQKEGLCNALEDIWKLEEREAKLSNWTDTIKKMDSVTKEVTVGVVGKYVELGDAYLSMVEALKHSQIPNNVKVNIKWFQSEDISSDNVKEKLTGCHGILVPGGFGTRGIEGMIEASRFARENKIPYFGICLGMQIAVIDYARHVLNLEDANSTEFDLNTPYPVIDLMPDQVNLDKKGGTMRLGNYKCKLKPDSKAIDMYKTNTIEQRHRHRYEFNNALMPYFENTPIKFSGFNPKRGLIEMIELTDHPFFVACQFHPELISRPVKPEPIFTNFVKAANDFKNLKKD
ncbi:MAG: CTP synthase [Caldisericia bacterium]|nr:CTP synthase [Caldisericia bacterium]